MIKEFKTEDKRLKSFKKVIIGLAIAATVTSGVYIGEYYLNADIDLVCEKVTGYEYDQLIPELKENIKKIANKQEIDYCQIAAWTAMANRELKKCSPFQIQNMTTENYINKVSNLIEKCKD